MVTLPSIDTPEGREFEQLITRPQGSENYTHAHNGLRNLPESLWRLQKTYEPKVSHMHMK
jgi:hypothetical protein